MKEEWLLPYEQNTIQKDGKDMCGNTAPMSVRLPGNTSTSQKLKVALDFAMGIPRDGFFPVLFVFAV